MAEAFKCDVVDCPQISEGSAPAEFTVNALGVKKHMCQSHTDALVKSYFPDLEKEDFAPVAGSPGSDESRAEA